MVSLNLPVYTLFIVIAIVSVSAIKNTKIHQHLSTCPEGYTQCNFQCVSKCIEAMSSIPAEGCNMQCSNECMSRCSSRAKRDIRDGLNQLPSDHETIRVKQQDRDWYCGLMGLNRCQMYCHPSYQRRAKGMGACLESSIGDNCYECVLVESN
ncbi:hypothetical protein FWK35_00005646 [Aphis craccivora]|uniref:Uncharacterized protein n=1 Tax=Aphis craccivora TaxID=307492 RepID=A0A6G0Z4X2_APHCR|nr:hypothetical protein FWK35_00005646 [Aphis craccivora]